MPAGVRVKGERVDDSTGLRAGAADLASAGAALQVAGLDPCGALVSFAAIGAAPEDVFASRGWTAAEWPTARDRLAARGWIDAQGKVTERGRQGRDEIEWRTDRLTDAPWRTLVRCHFSAASAMLIRGWVHNRQLCVSHGRSRRGLGTVQIGGSRTSTAHTAGDGA
jgi:hypothetical protein